MAAACSSTAFAGGGGSDTRPHGVQGCRMSGMPGRASIAHEGACEVMTPHGNDDGKIGDDGKNTIDDPEPGQEENNIGGGSAGMCGAGGLGMLPLLVLGLCGLKLGATGRGRRSVTTVTR